ncbi:uncharacterized protein [Rutidosis leptorrhynchoides]|uniref:uncharacterized protein n=1 Tax=Rutidosis leptorrhynchoides TaxID=125765 RepID=UPI003A99372C
MAHDRMKWLCAEVTKLVNAGILREVKYQTWVANPVLVKKPDGSCRMCIDFKDINKACSKDNYLLPEINLKVESLHAYPYKCFLDATKGYHQIPMAQEDEDKTAFHTGKGIYCYIKMPFRLKNAGATYQRLIDKAFEGQIGRNLEAYVDDLVIKSKMQEQILFDMEETFESLGIINMKLNPSKSFGSVLVAEQNKVQKPVYFVSKALVGSEINYVPIEKFIYALVLTSRRLCKYFQGHLIYGLTDLLVKQVLSTPAVSGRLAKWAIELGAFEITYFPRTSVKGQVLADYLAEMTGELEVIHERTQLKHPQHEIWDLYTDGASCIEGAGARLVLTSPNGEEHTYAPRFNIDVTNNEAEYEARLTELNMAHKMNILQLHAYIDSQLVANQFNGSFEAHELSLQKYLKLVQEAAKKFEFFELSQQFWVEELPNKSIDGSLIVAAIEEVQPNWMDPIVRERSPSM